MKSNDERGATFEYTVDGERHETREHRLTPREIVKAAGLDADERCLVEIRGKKQVSYKDRMDEPIQIHNQQKFITVFCGPVPVS